MCCCDKFEGLSAHKRISSSFLVLPLCLAVLGNHAKHDFVFHLFVLKWDLGMQSGSQHFCLLSLCAGKRTEKI